MLIDGFTKLSLIFESQRTSVWRGRRLSDDRAVVIKRPRTEYPSVGEVARYPHEFGVLRELAGAEGVIGAYDLLRVGNVPALVLEEIEGADSLTNTMETMPKDFGTLLRFFRRFAAALSAVHARGIVHKDINPNNVLRAPSGEVRLIDFAISSRLQTEELVMEAVSRLEGTFRYMSPEQTGRTNRSIDYRTDYYSLGVVFYELLAGVPPFDSNDPVELVHAHIARAPAPLHERDPLIPRVLSDLVMTLLEKEADARYQDMDGLLLDLDECARQWDATGSIEPFPLRGRQTKGRFRVPEALQGRQTELAELMAAFNEAASGRPSLTLVTGYSGIGKSSLVHELYRPVTERRGHFVRGKFDQFTRDVPYGAIIQAVRDYVRQIVASGSDELARAKQRLRLALGSNGAVVTNVVQEVEWIIGQQAPVPELNPAEAQTRFLETFQAFLAACAPSDQPLVLFLDDLQWADTPSLTLMGRLVGGVTEASLLVLGAYRNNEVDDAHPLMAMLRELEAQRDTGSAGGRRVLHRLELAPLEHDAVTNLVAETLQTSAGAVTPLADLIFEKTRGNPFFVNQFLTSIHTQKLLRFDRARDAWVWDLDRIRVECATDNVVEFVLGRVRMLPPATRKMLSLAACIGNAFDLSTLTVVSEQDAFDAAASLWSAMEEGFVVPIGTGYKQYLLRPDQKRANDFVAAPTVNPSSEENRPRPASYRFLHDRVQQAAYELIPAQERASVHLTIGRLLLGSHAEADRTDKLFGILHHFQRATQLVVDRAERAKLAELNLAAGLRAKASAAYAPAVSYLENALRFLPEDSWQTHYAMTFDISVELGECEFHTGNRERSRAIFTATLDKARSATDRARIRKIQVNSATLESKFDDAIRAGVEGLRELGVHLSATPSTATVVWLLLRAKTALSGREVDSLAAIAMMTEPEHVLTLELLVALVAPAVLTGNKTLQAAAVIKALLLILRRGVTERATNVFLVYGLIVAAALEDYTAAARSLDVGIRYLDRFKNDGQRGRALFMLAFSEHWREPYPKIVERYAQAFVECRDTGDPNYAGYALSAHTWLSLYTGAPLADLRVGCANEAKSLAQYRDASMLHFNAHGAEILDRLAGSLAAFDAWLARKVKAGESPELTPVNNCGVQTNLLLLACIFRRADLAAISAEWLAKNEQVITGMFYQPFFIFHAAIAITQRARHKEDLANGPEWMVAKGAAFLRKAEKKISKWAKISPYNYSHYRDMLLGERLRLAGESGAALKAFERAIEHTRKHRVLLLAEAQANELAGRLCVTDENLKLAQLYLRDARYAYELWGSSAKVEQLEEEFPELVRVPVLPQGKVTLSTTITSTANTSDATLDLATMVRASQAIAGEITVRGLLSKLMKYVLENAGAQSAALLDVRPDDTIRIRAAGRVLGGEGGIEVVTEGASLEKSVCVPIAEYVARTLELVILDDASQTGMFTNQPHVIETRMRSVLCMPLVQQAKLTGILYLENALVAGAFTPERVEVLRTLASSVAISIENATLYEDLEAKVVERTTQLKSANRSLRQLFDHMQQAIVAFGADGHVAGDFSAQARALFGGDALESRTAHQLLFGHLPEYEPDRMLFDEWFASAFTIDPADIDELCKLAPSRVLLHEGKPNETHLTLEFRPVISEGVVSRIMLLATDETEKFRLEQAVETEQLEHARQIAAMRRIAAGGPQLFISFLASSEARLTRFASDLGPRPTALGSAIIDQLFRHAHTMKADARTFELHALEAECAGLEEMLAELRSQAKNSSLGEVMVAGAFERLSEGIARARAQLAQGRDAFVQASPIGSAVLDQITVSRTDVEHLRNLVGARHDEVGRLLSRLASRPFGEAIVHLVESVPAWAQAMGKEARVEVSGREVRLSPELAGCLSSVLGHLVRNAVAHGIETPDERERVGKPRSGVIRLSCSELASGPAIVIEDDGGGVNLGHLRERAETAGVAVVSGHEADLMFVSGLSTRPRADEFAGRGVGLSAVRDDLEAVDMRIELAKTSSAGTRFVISPARVAETAGERAESERGPSASPSVEPESV